MIRFSLAVSFFLVAPAWADDPAPICHSLSDVAGRVVDCSRNELFVQAGKQCLAKLDDAISVAKGSLAGAMALASAPVSGQAGRIENASAIQASAQLTLTQLVAMATQARAEIVTYAQHFTFPGPMSEETAERLKIKPFLVSFPCFIGNQESLMTVAKDFDQRIQQLSAAAKKTETLATSGAGNAHSLQGVAAQTVHGRAPAGAGAPRSVPRGTSPAAASDITGVHQDELKQASPAGN